MNCRDIERDLLAYLHSEVTPSQKVLIQDHLAGCPACETELERLSNLEKRVVNVLAEQAAQAVLPADAWTRLRKGLPQPRQRSKKLLGVFSMKRGLAFVLVSLFLFVSTLFVVPSVRAQVEKILMTYFHFELPNRQGGIGFGSDHWSYTPYSTGYLPDGFRVKGTVSGGHEGPGYSSLSSVFSSDDHFIKLTQTGGESVVGLPEGEGTVVQGQPAVLVRNPDIEVYLKGELDNPADYETGEAYLLVWFMEGG
jgi:hypothetical protein